MDASDQGSRVTANGVVTRDSTNAAIVIAVLPFRKSADSLPLEIKEAEEMARWLTSSGDVPERNLRLITSEVEPNRNVNGPQPRDIETAFRTLYAARSEGRPSNTLVRNRLYVIAIGPGWGDQAGLVTLLTPSQVGVELTSLANQFRDERLFDEVVLIADVPRSPGHTGTATPIRLGSGLPREPNEPAAHFYAFSNRFGPRQSPYTEKRFTPTFLKGLAGDAKDAVGVIDAYSLTQFIEREYAEERDPGLKPEFQFGAGPPILFFRPPLEGQVAATEGADTAEGQADHQPPSAPEDARIEPSTGTLGVESDAPSIIAAAGQVAAAAVAGIWGGRLKFVREADEDELALNVDDYAKAVAQLYGEAGEGEFCLAIFGPWGRGKTFLMRRVDQALGKLGRGYRTILFSAWKYPSAPEVWVHLYEEFAKAGFDGPWYRVMPNVVRAGVAKHGARPLLWAYALFAFGLIPLGTLFDVAHSIVETLYPIVGVIGFVLLVTLFAGVRRTKARLSHEYLTASRHSEKLGLQATIGTDLRALLMGWIPNRLFGRGFAAWYVLITAALITAVMLRLAQGAELEYLASKYLGWKLVGAARLGVEVGLVAVIAGLFGAGFYWLRDGGASPGKIVLVVDDLDRCRPEHLLSVMESIKLLIEDPNISARVQVAMLLEEDILRHAIVAKYADLTDEKRAAVLHTQYDADRLIWENSEKLFTAHLRLPILAKSELLELIQIFAGRKRDEAEEQKKRAVREKHLEEEIAMEQRREPLARVRTGTNVERVAGEATPSKPVPPIERISTPVYREATAEEVEDDRSSRQERLRILQEELAKIKSASKFTTTPATQEIVVTTSQRVLEKPEIDAILAALDAQSGTRSALGPRAIRAFMFRYQLARLLLNTLKIEWSPHVLANKLAKKSFSRGPAEAVEPVSAALTDEQKLERVVDQVC